MNWLDQYPLASETRESIQALLVDNTAETADATWRQIIHDPRTPTLVRQVPLELFGQLWKEIFSQDQSPDRPPRPMWLPSAEQLSHGTLAAWMADRGDRSVTAFHRWSAEERSAFWEQAIARLGVCFAEPPTQILDESRGVENVEWLVNARLNIIESCFQAPSDRLAIVSGRDGAIASQMTYGQLLDRVKQIAGALRSRGFLPGDAIGVCTPMTAEAVAAYLGIVYAGCVAVSIADSFAPPEIASRLRIANAKAVITYDRMLRSGKVIALYDRIQQAQAPQSIVMIDPQVDHAPTTLRTGDLTWEDFLETDGDDAKEARIASPYDPINILFSSGTTGDPKAIPWNHLTPIKCATDAMLLQGVEPGDVLAWPTNLGWMMGPWLLFASLLRQATMALYEDAPVGTSFGEFIQNAKVTMLGVVPTLVKSWRSAECMKGLDWSSIRCFSSTGESSQADDMFYLSSLAGFRPVIEYCGGTEIGGGYVSSTLLQPNAPATFSTPAFGLDFVILDEAGHAANEGELFLIPPSIGLSQQLLNRDHHETYYQGTPQIESAKQLRRHGDHFRQLPGDYFAAGGRADDTMNLGGIKVSSAEIERVLNQLPSIIETAAVAVEDDSGGISRLVVFAVLESPLLDEKGNEAVTEELRRQCNQALRDQLNPLFKVEQVRVVDKLPRTASNKVMRRMLRRELDR